MLYFSKTSLLFIKRCNVLIREILTQEMNIKVEKSRFHFNQSLIPWTTVVFEDQEVLGFFNSNFFQIGINKKLMLIDDLVFLKNIIRHELAHMLLHLRSKNAYSDHGKEFHDLCREFNWGAEVWQAKTQLSETQKNSKNILLIEKVKKLLALASSSNEHEAQLATEKANSLLIDWNLQFLQDGQEEENETYLEYVLVSPRLTSKMQVIYSILPQFLVSPIINYGNKCASIEIIGKKVNVEIACYIAKFLDIELEYLWKQAKKNHPELKGVAARNSFWRGLAKGFIRKQKKSSSITEYGASLIKIEQSLIKQVELIHPRLGARQNSYQNNQNAHSIGEKKGESLSIRPALTSSSKSEKFYLTY